MGAPLVLDRIAGWESAGLIDHEAAERLRAAERSAADTGVTPGARAVTRIGIGVAELFAYLGGLFVLAAWHSMVLTQAGDSDVAGSFGSLSAAIALGIVGYILAHRRIVMARAAAVAYLVSACELAVAAFLAMEAYNPPFAGESVPFNPLVGAAVGLAAACLYRWSLPAIATQIGVIGGTLVTAWSAMQWADAQFFGTVPGGTPLGVDTNLLRVILTAGWWWLITGLLGALAYAETRSDPSGPSTRAGLTRLAAGLTAVLGTTMAVTMTRPWTEAGNGGRVLDPAIGVTVELAVAAILVALALRRASSAYLWPAALGFLIAFSDLNATYVAGEAGMATALFVEALILFGVAGVTDQVRRRIRRAAEPSTRGTDRSWTEVDAGQSGGPTATT